ncbi:MAG TPA: zf-HC2 domain-containing protein [Thermoleophilaceae bacterium]|nr:zf-HC2 domain-containing protein [Thermoleophilaceae bacterium]
MSCQELVDAVTAYIEGTLPRSERARFEAHLAECSHCRTYLEQMRGTIARLGTLREQELAPETRAGLLEAFRGWRETAVCRGR